MVVISMASPHVAGLAAYFLSLYPEGFSALEDDFTDATYSPFFKSNNEEFSFIQQSAQMVIGKFQQWSGRSATVVAPIPTKPLSPKALKAAMIKISTKNALPASVSRYSTQPTLNLSNISSMTQDLPAGTPNALIFNNFTTASLTAAVKEAMANE